MLAVVAMPEEIDLLKDEHKKNYIVTGSGALNVINALKNIDKETQIINVGYVGSNSIPIGERVRIGEARLYHPNVKIAEDVYLLDGNIVCYTSSDFVLSTSIIQPCVFDMELAFIMALGFRNVISEKIISDHLSIKEFSEVCYGQTKNRN